MSGIRTGIGLVSGLNTADIVDALISAQRRSVVRLERRVQTFQAKESGLQILHANLLALASPVQQLKDRQTFQAFHVRNSDEMQLTATPRGAAVAGDYRFQTVQTAARHEILSRGVANADRQTFGTGTLTLLAGGGLHRPTTLDVLNGGDGVRRGVIRVTDRAGVSADIDLSNAYDLDDVLRAINSNNAVSVTAAVRDSRLVLTDDSGGAGTLRVADLNGHAALDLGIRKTAAADTLDGDDVHRITGDFLLSRINDGNGPRTVANLPDLRIRLSDDTLLDVELHGADSLSDLLARINNHESNDGKLTASLVEGRLVLEDHSGGAGTLSVQDMNQASVVRQLGLNAPPDGDTLTGHRLAAGINSVLLRNLNGGRGIDTPGEITLTDRNGTAATIDLSGAETLDDVLDAINAAHSGGGTKLQLVARINAAGTGIELRDTSGGTGNLIVADVGTGTLAAQLGIAVDAPQDGIDSGPLRLRHVNQASSLSTYAPNGGAVANGSFVITDSAGKQAVISITSNARTIGDVMERINAAAGVSVRAELNETGDGFVLIDEANGAGTLSVQETGGRTAADLRLLGPATTDQQGRQQIDSRRAAVVEIDSDDTLDTIAQKINAAGGPVTASIVNDGTTMNSTRLSLTAKTSGAAGRMFIEQSGIDLGLATRTAGRDALLRVGPDAASGFLIASGTNTFRNAAPGVDVEVHRPGTGPADIVLSRDTAPVADAVRSFVSAWNTYITITDELTKFDFEAGERGILQGEGFVLRLRSRLEGLVTQSFGGSDQPVRSLFDLGVRFGERGRLTLDEERLTDVLRDHPQAVSDFFLEPETGFAAVADATFKSFTDPFTGTFQTEENALTTSIESLTQRIEQLDAVLESRRDRLLREFVRMEEALSLLMSHQDSISRIAPLRMPSPAGGN